MGCFYILAIMNNSLMYIGVKKGLWEPDFDYFGQIFWSGMVRSNGTVIFYIL